MSSLIEQLAGQAPEPSVGSGQVIGDRFEIQSRVGAGGMGTVYRAFDRRTGALVALKVARAQGDTERFLREAAALASLDHPRIVRYVAHGTLEGAQYLAMEWLAGMDLSERLERGHFNVEESVEIARAAAEALAALHGKGLVHRDVKPGNLFLCGGTIAGLKLLDFGIARSMREAVHLTQTGQALGTPSYMAPEQARGEDRLDARADVFALGCVLFECLTGRPPFIGDHPIAVLAKLLIQDAPRLSEVRPGVPRGLEALVARMLAKEPSGRPSDGAAVLDELSRLDRTPSFAPPADLDGRALTGDEQRILCVVLTRPAGEMDATMMPAQRPRAEDQMRAAITMRGGRLERLANGSMLAAVHGGESAADLAARAARCALMLAGSLGPTPVVLATGRGIVAGLLPAGAVVDQAVRLLGSGAWRAGTVRIDPATASLLDARFDVRPEGEDLYLFGEREVAEGPRTLLGKLTPCVGREREIGTLSAILRECVSEPIARAVLVTAPAGVGKSRVLSEFLRGARAIDPGALVLAGRGDVVSAGSAFSMAAGLLRRASGMLDGESFETKRNKLRARLGRHLEGDALRSVTEMLGEIAGAPALDTEASVALRSARADAMVMGDAIRTAWEDWLAAECDAGPVLLAIEDLHWGDLPSVSLIDAALRRLDARPFFVIATARPEVHTTFPELWARRELQEIRVSPLTPRASERLVREVLGKDVDEATVAFVARRAEGHPFFLEEMIRAIAEGRGSDSLPDTVLSMLEGRLDALAPEQRRVLRAASVLGATFWRGAVAALVGGPTAHVGRALEELATKEIIVRRRASRIANEIEYGFHHALVRDAAYAMLTDADRQLGHRLAGEWLEHAGETDPVALAEHFERGSDSARALRWYKRGAEQALEGNDLARVLERGERALRAGPDEETRGSLELLMAEASYYRGELARAESLAASAVARLAEGSAAWFHAASTAVRASGQLGKNDDVHAWGTRVAAVTPRSDTLGESARSAKVVCLARCASQLYWAQRTAEVAPVLASLLETAGDLDTLSPSAEAWVHRVLADKAFLADGRMDRMQTELRDASAGFDRAGAVRDACQLRAMEGAYLGLLGEPEAGEKVILRALADAERLDSKFLVHFAYAELPIAHIAAARYDDARKAALRALEGLGGSPRIACGLRIVLSIVAFATGKLDEAELEARAAADTQVAPPMRAAASGMLARILTAQGRLEEALLRAKEGVKLAQSGGALEMFAGTAELSLAEVENALGHRDAAHEALAKARARVHAVVDPIADPALRAKVLLQPHPFKEIMELSRAWGDL